MISMNETVFENVRALCRAAKEAQVAFAGLSGGEKSRLIEAAADAIEAAADKIEEANAADMTAAGLSGYPKPMLDRLLFDKPRIRKAADAMRQVASFPDPCGGGERIVRPNGLVITKVRVPMGVVGIIYEARPNVTADAAAIAMKSGNAAVLRGGREALNTNIATAEAIKSALGRYEGLVQLVADTTRDGANAMMRLRGYIDVLIPRGGVGLIRSVVENSTVPVIETGAGNCHIYIDKSADLEKSLAVAVNAKCSRPAVCNAVETMLVHKSRLRDFLPEFYRRTRDAGVEFRCDPRALAVLSENGLTDKVIEAAEEDYQTEYDDLIIAVKTVEDVGEAIEHIEKYSTRHSDGIMTESLSSAERFQREVDSACVYVNVSTRFTDGGEFGLGAEMGISTQKLHVRGPMGAEAMTTTKYIVCGDGQIR